MAPVGVRWNILKPGNCFLCSGETQCDVPWYLVDQEYISSAIQTHKLVKNGQKSHFSVKFGTKMAPVGVRLNILKPGNCFLCSGETQDDVPRYLFAQEYTPSAIQIHQLVKNGQKSHFR